MLNHRGVNFAVLRPLRRPDTSPNLDTNLSMVLLNVRSLTSKSFILNDFFKSNNLDVMFLTETWQPVGDFSQFSELLPPDCSFLSSPRSTSSGGGLATVFRSNLQCQLAHCDISYPSFELQQFQINLTIPVFCAVVYRPPKYNASFIHDFGDFLSGIMDKYNYVLILGDMNVHVCCQSRPLVAGFLNLLDSFNLVQSVSGPTHEKGHTLDLILSHGLSVSVSEIRSSFRISDHFPLFFNVSIPGSSVKPRTPAYRQRSVTAATAPQFSLIFNNSVLHAPVEQHTYSADELLHIFNATCTSILDSVAPLAPSDLERKALKHFLSRG